ncbi:hypothetical protein [Kineosporia sp. A_224]|uniref:hypothetical protein n=1 Tax=Kineosporia sp. A_224 TaxID=1962180 RepID=UPI00117B6BFA|nr:hypothetical protein [Kineosporia sp. A_224]
MTREGPKFILTLVGAWLGDPRPRRPRGAGGDTIARRAAARFRGTPRKNVNLIPLEGMQELRDLATKSAENLADCFAQEVDVEQVIKDTARIAEERNLRRKRQRFSIVAGLAALTGAIFFAFLTGPWPVSSTSKASISNFVQLGAAAFGATICWTIAFQKRRRGDGIRHRMRSEVAAWVLFGAACAAWATGQSIWTWLELRGGEQAPFPSWADAGFAPAALFTFAGLMLYPTALPKLTTRWRGSVWLIEAALGGVVLCCAGWVFLVEPAMGGLFGWPAVLAAFYPLADLVNGAVAVVAVARAARNLNPLVLLAAGIAAWSCADIAFLVLQHTGAYATADQWVDTAWVLGFLTIGVAGMAPSDYQITSNPGRFKEIANTLPVLAVGTVTIAGIYRWWATAGSIGPVVLLSAVLVALLLLLQTRFLSERVREYDDALPRLTQYFSATQPTGASADAAVSPVIDAVADNVAPPSRPTAAAAPSSCSVPTRAEIHDLVYRLERQRRLADGREGIESDGTDDNPNDSTDNRSEDPSGLWHLWLTVTAGRGSPPEAGPDQSSIPTATGRPVDSSSR